MSEEKTFVFPEGAGSGSSSVDPNVLLAMMNNGNSGFGGNGSWLWVIFLFFLYGWGGNGMFGRGNGGGLANEINNDYGRELLSQAIAGNRTAISELATNLHVDTSAIQGAINSLQTSINAVGNQVGMSAAQVTSAIQSGNQALSAQLAQCCCDNKLLVTTQGYENQIATLNQTNQLGSKIDGNTTAITNAIAAQSSMINDKFCQLEMREMQTKIDALTADKNSLISQLSNEHQTAQIQGYVASVVSPIASDVAALKAAAPPTVAVPYPQLSAVPTNYLYSGLYGTSVFTNGQWA